MVDNISLKEEIKDALDNATLGRTLGNFCKTYPKRRLNSYQGIDFKETQQAIKRVKTFAAEHVDEMISEFKKNCEARGGHVVVVKSKEEAEKWVENFLKEKDIKTAVKSKSMCSEEIHFNKILKDNGVDCQETDLGEFIISLEGNSPVHMVMPALHLNKEQVADYFSEYTKTKHEPIISEEVKTSRRVMRDKFKNADLGVSGANVAVAETGTVFTMTNEGNGRMVGTLPKNHLYIFGIEKFVNSISDARWIFKALPRNGTAQRITAYLSLYTGACEVTTDKESDTKEEKGFYCLIIDDPGRREILAQEGYREIFNCIRCGACLDVCPAFALVGGHVYGSNVYTGGIGTLLTHFLIDKDRANEIESVCLQCGRCNEVCGGGLPIAEMIMKVREEHVKENPDPIKKFALDAVTDRKLFHSLLRIASIAQEPFTKGDTMIRHLPDFVSGMTGGKVLPSIAKVPLRDIFDEIEQDVENQKGTVALFAGCLLDFVYVDTAKSLIKNMNSIGYKVEFPLGQACCGCPASNMGDVENARKEAEINIKAMDAEKYDYILLACPSCTHQLQSYKDFFEQGSEMYERAKVLGEKCVDFCKLFHEKDDKVNAGDGKEVKVTYHDSCHLKRTLGVYEEPRDLLKNTEGVEFVEMEDSDNCCGFAGSYNVLYPDISSKILKNKIENIKNSGADVVAVDCPGCMMQIRGGLEAEGLDIKVKHTSEIISEKRGLI